MQHRQLGRTKITISAIIFGGWQAGKSGWTGVNDDETVAAHQAAFDSGITTFDTAEAYGEGHSERILAQALGSKRDQIVIATKVFADHLKHAQVIEACERSLKNLDTDRIDLYQIHWPSGSFGSDVVPIEETMGALAALKEQGKIRAIGVSNFSRAQLQEAAQYGRIDSLQPPYSLFWRQVEADAGPYCLDNKISIIAYSPLAQGLLTGKFGRTHKFEEGDNRGANKLFQGDTYERAQNALDKLRPLADKYGVSLGNLALAWLIAQPQTNAIVGARNAEQATQNAAAGDVEIDEDDLDAIDEIGRTVTDRLDNNPMMWELGRISEPMQFSEIGGEFGLINRLRTTYAGAVGNGLALGIGDDAAVLDIAAGQQVVVTTDLLIEGMHFRRDWSDPYSIGWKAAAVNLSDLVAMGADPTFTFVSLALPLDETVEELERLYDGLSDCLNRYGARLAGGDTNASAQGLFVSIAQMGTVPTGQALTRGGAKVGDILLVTGTLGDSAAGLALLTAHGPVKADKLHRTLVQAHRRPQPRVVAARAARETGFVHACLDLSDGLAGDLAKLCTASGVGARVDLSALPLSADLSAVASELGKPAYELALHGGEDYELLMAAAPADVEALRAAVAATGTQLTPIGEVLRTGLHSVGPDGADLPWEPSGWDHFAL